MPSGPSASREPIAIIGIGCRFPGEANDPASFWKLLSAGVDAITEIPEDRWSIEQCYQPLPGVPGKTYSRWGGFIKGIDQFEPECFGISPREAAFMDPQQRLLLEVAWEALEDSGEVMDRVTGTNTGVFIGISSFDYAQIQAGPYDPQSVSPHNAAGGATSIAANRISYCLNLTGPSLAVDTACSSSLVATHLACQSIWNHECEQALAGGVNILLSPLPFITLSAASVLSPDGRCKAFDANANGFVRSEGAGIVVLKPLSKALAHRDPIYALILSSVLNQDGRTAGMMVPSQTAQEGLLREACRQAGIAPSAIHYVEAHGTGTAIGDPIEAMALGNVLCANRPKDQYCLMGSVKTNIGHLEAVAGVAGVIKAALVLRHRMIPPNLHFLNPNPSIPFEELQLRVPCSLERWPDDIGPAIAGVNSFGFGGANAHIVMMEYRQTRKDADVRPKTNTPAVSLLPLSARTHEALQTLARSYQELLERDGIVSMQNLCYTASVRRAHFDHRLCLVVRTREDLLKGLEAFLAGEGRPGMSIDRRVHGKEPKLAFVLSGQGPQWWRMGRELLETEPAFRDTIERCEMLLRPQAEWSLMAELTADEPDSRLQETAIAQPALFALQVALAALWKSWGIEPDAVVGHSLGEIAAAHIAGALPLADALRVAFHRSRCMDVASSKGKMLAVGCPALVAEQAIHGYEGHVSVAAANSPSSATLSGNPAALEEIARELVRSGIFTRFLHVDYAFHSPYMEPLQEKLLASLDGLGLQPCALPMISTVTGDSVEGWQLDKYYWWLNVREKVRFAEAVDRLIAGGYDAFLELSPHPVLSGYVSESLLHHGRHGTVLPSLRRQEAERATMLGSFGGLYALGYPVDWRKLWPDGGHCVSLPRYPWQRQRYWNESEELRELRLGRHGFPLLGRNIGSSDPSWRLVIDKRSLRYLEDHRVQEHAVFPAAGYVEMVLEAAHESLGEGEFILEEIQFQRALFLPDSGGAPTVLLSYYPADGSFAIQSKEKESDPTWTVHTIGYLRPEHDPRPPQQVDPAALCHELHEEISPEDCYRVLDGAGLHYGPAFRGIERLWRRDGEVLGKICLDRELAVEGPRYCFHPALLDSCLHAFAGALRQEDGASHGAVYLPVQIERVRFYRRPKERVWSHVHLTHVRANALEADVRVYDEVGTLLLALDGFKCQAVKGKRAGSPDDMQNLFYQVNWRHKPRPEQPVGRRSAGWIPGTREMARAMVGEAHRLDLEGGWSTLFSAAREPLERLSVAYIIEAFRDLGWPCKPGDCITVDSLMNRLSVAPLYRKLMRRYLCMLEKAGHLTRGSPDSWVVGRELSDQAPQELWRQALFDHPSFVAELVLIGRCGSQLAAVLRGEMDPLLLIFPEGSIATTEHFYQDSPLYRFYNIMVQKVVGHVLGHLPDERTVRILEVGAGTGGMTAYVAPVLPAHRTEYVFSDVTQLFLYKAEQKLRDHPFMRFQLLNIEEDPLQQDFEANSFDLILASDVLHATGDLREALRNLSKLLASDGLLVFMEPEWVTEPSWIDLVFGLTAGWWRLRDEDLRPDYPLLRKAAWKAVLEEVGFRDPLEVTGSGDEEETVHEVLLARAPRIPETVPAVADQPRVELPEPKRRDWLIFADGTGVAHELVRLLKLHGEKCFLVTPGEGFMSRDDENFQVNPDSPEDLQRLVQAAWGLDQGARVGAIHLWGLDTPPPEETSLETLQRAEVVGCHCIIHLLQAWSRVDAAELAPRLVLVTRGAHPVSPSPGSVAIGQAPLLGLGRMIAHEHPNIDCKMVDLGLAKSPDEIRSLFAELWTEDPEEEIALRDSARFVPRVERAKPERVPVRHETLGQGDQRAFRLEISTPGIMDNLILRETHRQPPGPGEIEIEVHAASLNFRDVMKVLGLDPTEVGDQFLLGDECAGRIVAVGPGVEHLRLDDEVFGIAPGSLGSYVTTPASHVIRMRADMTFEEAATAPVVFLTAYYALHHLAGIREGERVLIHSATGGVGLAALQIARNAGAEIFATAGSQEKREMLRFWGVQHVLDSRSLTFADQVMEITGGQGVDIILNSLAGKAIPRGIACLAPYGRFLELGKRDIYQNSKLGLRGLRKNVSFFAVDLTGIIAARPESTKALLDELSRATEAKTFHLLPHRVFPVSRTVDAVRYLAQAKHIGKIVISMTEHGLSAEPLGAPMVAFRPDATYLITGGLGLTLAKWITEHGGRNVVLTGRSGASSEETRRALDDLQRSGARVVAAKSDCTDRHQMAGVLDVIDQTMPPLAGIFHAAMVLDDGILLQLDRERFRKVMSPKMDGAWNLHALTVNKPLDFFVLFSSASSVVGTPGQGNYVAANAFLDNFAYYRRSLGLPGTTVNWGHVTETGYVSRFKGLSELLAQKGFLGLSPEQAMRALDRTLQTKPIQLGVMRMDWRRLAQSMPKGVLARRLSLVIDPQGAEQEGGLEGSGIRESFRHAKPEERAGVIQTYIREQVARVLGTASAKLEADRPLNELGLDSLMGIELKNRIESDLAVSLPTRELMEGPTINKLVTVALDRLATPHASPSVPSPSPEVSRERVSAAVERLSDEEVDSLLAQMLRDEIVETPQTQEIKG